MDRGHTGHAGESGIQGHSCGPIMPWTIVIVGDGFDSQHVHVMHGGDGRVLTNWHYAGISPGLLDLPIGQHKRTFVEAHRLATEEAAGQIHRDAALASGMAFDETLRATG